MQRAVLSHSLSRPPSRPFSRLALATLTLACSAALTTPAWALYKVVGPDGKVTYTDRAPSDQPAQAMKSNGATASTDGLPFEVQRVASKYPVTLYVSNNCSACDTGRQLLKSRGIPFVEKTIVTNDDIRAFSKLEGTDQLPVVRIGQKQLIGFNQTDWTGYLDAAGYPPKSVLPMNYRWPAATPLAPQAEAKPAPTEAPRPTPRQDDASTTPSGASPSGIRF